MAAGEFNRAELLRRRVERPRLSDMAEDFGVLAAELERCFGGTGTMPTRAQLRAVLRSDLEKAIAAHGGPKAVSKKLGWRLAYQARSLSHHLHYQGTHAASSCTYVMFEFWLARQPTLHGSSGTLIYGFSPIYPIILSLCLVWQSCSRAIINPVWELF